MAAGDVVYQEGTQIWFGVSGSYVGADPGTNLTRGTPTYVTLDLSSLADGAARQSDQVDLGANRAIAYEVLGCIELAIAGFTYRVPELWWAPSTSGTAANGNVFGNSGADGTVPDGTVGSPSALEFQYACQFIGSWVNADTANYPLAAYIGTFSPMSRYGQLVVVNNTGRQLEVNMEEMHIVFNPIVRHVETS